MFYWEIYGLFKTAGTVNSCSVKEVLLKVSQYSHENTCDGVSKQGYRPATLLGDSKRDVLLWILWNF